MLQYHPWYLSATLVERFYSYFINNLAVRKSPSPEPRLWIRSKVTTMGHLEHFWGSMQNLRIPPRNPSLSGFLSYLHRKLRHQRIGEGGWHFSWMMTPEQMIQKIENYSHTEHNRPDIKSIDAIRSALQNGTDILGKGERFRLVEVDSTFPWYLREHLDEFRAWYLDPHAQSPKEVSDL